jgi:hypothetical protein
MHSTKGIKKEKKNVKSQALQKGPRHCQPFGGICIQHFYVALAW